MTSAALPFVLAGLVLAQAEPPAPAPGPGGGPAPDPAEQDQAHRPPVDVPGQGSNERLIENLAVTRGDISLGELVEEILADVVAEMATRPAKWMSPMALRRITLGANISPGYAAQLSASIVTAVHAGSDVRIVECLECRATQSGIVGQRWVVTRGLVDTAQSRRVAEAIGAKTFLDVTFGFEPRTNAVQMDFTLVRAADGVILWADSFRADDTTPMLQRSSYAPQRRADRVRDLEMLLEGRPFYGYVATAGFMVLPYDDPVDGDVGGATAGYRIYERFGPDRRVMFGLDLTGFINTERLAGGLISAGSWWVPIPPDFIHPELRLGAKAGAFVAGTEGNAAVFQLGAEVLLRYRFGLYAYALFMTTSQFAGYDLGGLGFALGMSFNW